MTALDEAIALINRGEIKSIAFGNSAAPTQLGTYFVTLNMPWRANNPNVHGDNLDDTIRKALNQMGGPQYQQPIVTSAPPAQVVTRAPTAAPSAPTAPTAAPSAPTAPSVLLPPGF